MAKKTSIQAYVTDETKKAIIKRAEKEKRSVSNTAGIILDESIKKQKPSK